MRQVAAAARMKASLALVPEHRRLVLDLLAEHLPQGAQVLVFGSRATGRAGRYSDLDLAVDAGRPLTLDEAATLREGFEESDLPWRVDIIDLCAIDERFRRAIAPEMIALHDAP